MGLKAGMVRRYHAAYEAVMSERLRALESENKTLREQLQGLPVLQANGQYVGDLERRNAYLEGELKRRDGLEQPQRRPWWKVWG